MVGLSVIGCTPSVRKDIEGEECSTEINDWCSNYNKALKSMLQKLASELKDIKYSYFDTYSILTNLIDNQASYGTN